MKLLMALHVQVLQLFSHRQSVWQQPSTVADAVSTEARAKYNKSVQFNDYDIFKGLTYWTPNINIFRDPRWGRGQETYGEDPFLTATMGVSYIKGLQGDGEFFKSCACAKHYAVHSGPERLRHGFDAKANKKDMAETYLPAFEYAVKNEVAGVMGAYNRTNGEPCCAHSVLMQDILFDKWGFKGYFVSDCGAINDIYEHHKYKDTKKETAAIALERGCHLNCGEAYAHLIDAYEEDLITDEAIDEAVLRLYTIRVLLGEFEEERPYSDVAYDKLDCAEHRALNLEASKQTMVLLKNENNALPLKRGEKIALFGKATIEYIKGGGGSGDVHTKYIRNIFEGFEQKESEDKVSVYMPLVDFYKEYVKKESVNVLTEEQKAVLAKAEKMAQNTVNNPETDDAVLAEVEAKLIGFSAVLSTM